MPGWWNLPGGGVDDGESMRQAAVRELAEEAGLVVEPDALSLHYRTWLTPSDGPRWEFVAFEVTVPDGWEPTLCFENDLHQWCAVPDLPTNLVDPLPLLFGGLSRSTPRVISP